VIATLDDLSEDDLVRILKEPKNAVVRQYQKLFEIDGVKLEVTDEALRIIARKAIKRGTGARALKNVFEEMMIDMMFELPNLKNVEKVVITEEVALGKEKPIVVMRESA